MYRLDIIFIYLLKASTPYNMYLCIIHVKRSKLNKILNALHKFKIIYITIFKSIEIIGSVVIITIVIKTIRLSDQKTKIK